MSHSNFANENGSMPTDLVAVRSTDEQVEDEKPETVDDGETRGVLSPTSDDELPSVARTRVPIVVDLKTVLTGYVEVDAEWDQEAAGQVQALIDDDKLDNLEMITGELGFGIPLGELRGCPGADIEIDMNGLEVV